MCAGEEWVHVGLEGVSFLHMHLSSLHTHTTINNNGQQAVILAYGQTGSGKTYTMEGVTHTPTAPAAPAAAPTVGEGDKAAVPAAEEEEEATAAAASSEEEAVAAEAGAGAGARELLLPEGAGVNPRALAELFRLKAEREEQGMADVQVSGGVWARVLSEVGPAHPTPIRHQPTDRLTDQ